MLNSMIDIYNLSILVGNIYNLMPTLRNSISCLSNTGPEITTQTEDACDSSIASHLQWFANWDLWIIGLELTMTILILYEIET